jgi:restriction system protein
MWIYGAPVHNRASIRVAVESTVCIFCDIELKRWFSKSHFRTGYTTGVPPYEDGIPWVDRDVNVCEQCGWWTVKELKHITYGYTHHESRFGATAGLKNLDLSDQSIPLSEIRGYLHRQYSGRYEVDPWRFEHVVADVYANLGYRTRVTSRSKDGGIDIVLDGPADSTIGVQVKRYKGRIAVDQIRAFTGALVASGLTHGIFVTTSTFTKSAEKLAADLDLRGIGIELLDHRRFFEALEIGQRNTFDHLDDPSFRIRVLPLEEDTGDPESGWAI